MTEVMITITILGFLGVGVSYMLNKSSGDAANQKSRKTAATANIELLDVMKRDFKYRTKVLVEADGTLLALTRRNLYEKGFEEDAYEVFFESRCAKISSAPEVYRSTLETIFKGTGHKATKTVLASTPNKCMQKINCKSDEFPQVVINGNLNKARTPLYPRRSYPNEASNKTITTFGTSACFVKSEGKIRVAVETLYLLNADTTTVAMKTDEVVLTSPIRFFDILPN